MCEAIGIALDAAPQLELPPLSEGARAANETTDTRWQVSKQGMTIKSLGDCVMGNILGNAIEFFCAKRQRST